VKFCTFSAGGQTRFGLIPEDGLYIDLQEAVKVADDAESPSIQYLAGISSLRQWLELGDPAFRMGERILEIFRDDRELLSGALFAGSDIRLMAPVRNPEKIMAIGLNYRDHAEEQNVPLPDHPRMFAKFPSAVIGPEEPIRLPRSSEKVDPEAELCIVILKGGKHLSLKQAKESAGFMIGNDVSARDLQFSDKQWVRGKSCDSFAPCGPYIATLDEVGDPHDLQIELRRNGEVKQSSSTSNLIFNCWELIQFISRTTTLSPGDIIFTGTPAGVGVFRDPPEFLEPGDVVEVEIEKLGTLRNSVIRD